DHNIVVRRIQCGQVGNRQRRIGCAGNVAAVGNWHTIRAPAVNQRSGPQRADCERSALALIRGSRNGLERNRWREISTAQRRAEQTRDFVRRKCPAKYRYLVNDTVEVIGIYVRTVDNSAAADAEWISGEAV